MEDAKECEHIDRTPHIACRIQLKKKPRGALHMIRARFDTVFIRIGNGNRIDRGNDAPRS